MNEEYRDAAAKKITAMTTDQVLKLLIFMAGMEAEATAERCPETSPTTTKLEDPKNKLFTLPLLE